MSESVPGLQLRGVPELAACSVSLLGYQPGENDVTVVMMRPDNHTVLAVGNMRAAEGGAIPTEGTLQKHWASALSDSIRDLDVPAVHLIAWGARWEELTELACTVVVDDGIAIASVCGVDEHRGVHVYDTHKMEFKPPVELPDLGLDMVARGVPLPAASRQELAASYVRDGSPFEPLPASSPLAEAKPSVLYSSAMALLDQSRALRPHEQAVVAHALQAGGTAVIDSVVIQASSDKQMADHLVEAWRRSPDSYAAVLAGAAAMSLYCSHGKAVGARVIAETSLEQPMARMVLAVALSGRVSPERMRGILAQGDPAASLAAADEQWQRIHEKESWELDVRAARAPFQRQDQARPTAQSPTTAPKPPTLDKRQDLGGRGL